ncbi:hypothetical protein ACTXT7_004150 [Hymenolepis weldensis]
MAILLTGFTPMSTEVVICDSTDESTTKSFWTLAKMTFIRELDYNPFFLAHIGLFFEFRNLSTVTNRTFINRTMDDKINKCGNTAMKSKTVEKSIH